MAFIAQNGRTFVHIYKLQSQVAQAHYEHTLACSFFAYIMSRQNIRVCMENATKNHTEQPGRLSVTSNC